MLNMPFLVLLSVLDVFDNQLEVKHFKIQQNPTVLAP